MKGELIFGVNPVKEALLGERAVFELYVQISATDHRLEKILSLAEKQGIPLRRREKQDLTKLCASSHHQGVALLVAPFMYADFDELLEKFSQKPVKGFLLVLDGILDPHNLGALIRSAACSGCDAVIIPKDRAAAVTPTVEKSSAGAVETVPVSQVTNIANTLQTLKDAGYWVYGLAGDTGESLYKVDFSGKVVVVIGGEGEGLRPLVRKQCDQLLSIPMYGGVSSLNASVAGGIAMFEVARKLYPASHS